MEVKKSQKADLESKKGLMLEIGLCASLLLTIGAFAWGQGKKELPDLAPPEEVFIQQEEIENTIQDTPVPQMPTPANIQTMIATEIEIVDDNTKIETQQIFQDFQEDFSFTEAATVAEVAGDMPDFFEKVEFMPKFQGGDISKFRTWVMGQIRYPEMAAGMGIQGTVEVQFFVNPDGSLSNIEVISKTNKELNNEAIRVVKRSPKWEPGRQGAVPVKVRVKVPVTFRLQ